MKIEILSDEYWWGGIVHEGVYMPIGRKDNFVFDFRDQGTPNQVSPIMLSSKGRYLWCDNPFCAVIKNGMIDTDEIVEQGE